MARGPIERVVLRIRSRARSREVSSFFAQLEELSGRQFADLADGKAAELAWQPRRGMNTIGMLLAHCAVVEAFWLLVAARRCSSNEAIARLQGAIGADMDLDGMPLAAGAAPPRSLSGWTLPRYRRLHDRARAFAKRTAARWRDAELDPPFRNVRANGVVRVVNVRWILYHVLEHQAGHYGQMLLLRHQYGALGKK